MALALRALQVSESSQEVLASVLAEVVVRLEALPEAAQAELRRALEYLFLLVHHKRTSEEEQALAEVMVGSVQRLYKEAENMAKTSAQVLLERGREEGLKERRVEGREEGQRALLLAQLEHKFGPLSEQTRKQIAEMAEDRLNAVAMRLLTAQTLEEAGLPAER